MGAGLFLTPMTIAEGEFLFDDSTNTAIRGAECIAAIDTVVAQLILGSLKPTVTLIVNEAYIAKGWTLKS